MFRCLNGVDISEAMRPNGSSVPPPKPSANSVGLSEATRPKTPFPYPSDIRANSVGLSEAMRPFVPVVESEVMTCQQRWSLGSDATVPVGARRREAQVPTALVSRKRCDRCSSGRTCRRECANSVGLSEAMRHRRASHASRASVVPTASVSRKRCDGSWRSTWTKTKSANSVGLSEAMRLVMMI